MFYTKYRPQKFSEISKPNDVADAISTQVKNGKIAHAYLFVGPRGTGKTTTARILAKALNCEHIDKNGDPCSKCQTCLDIANGSFLDLIEIDAASNRGIDDIRDLKEKIKLSPSSGKKKVYIIDEVHMLTTEAFNALLKTLEEPPSHTAFILCTTELHKVPDTIKSRCQLFKFKRASVSQLVQKLKNIASTEGATLSDEELNQIASAAHGGYRDAETLLQQVIEGEISVKELLSAGNIDTISEFVDLLFANNTVSALHLVNKLYSDGLDLSVWIGELLKYLRNLLLVSVNAQDGLVDMSDEILNSLKKQSASVNSNAILKYLEVLSEAQKNTKSSFITQLPLELAVVKLCTSNDATGGFSKDSSNPIKPTSTSSTQVDDKKPAKDHVAATKAASIKSAGVLTEEASQTVELSSELVTANVVVNNETVIETEDGAAFVAVTEETNIEVVEELASTDEITAATDPINEELPQAISGNLIDLSAINDKWEEIIKEVTDINNTTAALLKVCKLSELADSVLYLEVPFDFHKERMESTKNKTMIETAIKNALGSFIQISCVVKKRGKLTDYNVVVPTGAPAKQSKEDLLGFFDGGLPF